MLPGGRTFYKMSGSGNDFVVVNATTDSAAALMQPNAVQAVCARATGIGADGLVILEPSASAAYRMTYLNSDGSRADLCGNATLCSARLASELGLLPANQFQIETDAGVLEARLLPKGPEIDLPVVQDVRHNLPFRLERGERAIGFALAGVPHLVVRVDDVSSVDVVGRGRPLRNDPSLEHGANVNFVSRESDDEWRVRTFERGVEGETLACGTGAVATAILLAEAGEVTDSVELTTRSGRALRVRLRRIAEAWYPSLSGEARIVFEGRFGEI
ncbi:MAG: diaminopimelate epimerase [Gemmatimonadota bacterium]|nr:diaminopimelate epimerase [Gemmatimonadota bacterium]